VHRILPRFAAVARNSRFNTRRLAARLDIMFRNARTTLNRDIPAAPRLRYYGGQAMPRAREMCAPLSHRPDRARADFGQADGYIADKKVRLHYFCLYLPHADGCFSKTYPAEPAEAFCDGHVAAFDFQGTRSSGGGHDFVPRPSRRYSRSGAVARLWPCGPVSGKTRRPRGAWRAASSIDPHETYRAAVAKKHGRKSGFWSLVKERK
jgi:hypothetical protein